MVPSIYRHEIVHSKRQTYELKSKAEIEETEMELERVALCKPVEEQILWQTLTSVRRSVRNKNKKMN
jgi:hypothetical protein